MNRLIETLFCLRDDQIRKQGRALALFGVSAGVSLIALAVLIVVQYGLRMEPIRETISQISDKLLQQANSAPHESGPVIQTAETLFLAKMGSLITKVPLAAGLLLFAVGLSCIQCGLLYRRLKREIDSPQQASPD